MASHELNIGQPSWQADLEDDKSCQHLVKVVFVGEAGVGKTCLMERLFSSTFDMHTQPTIGVDFRFKRYIVDDKSVGVTLWDTAGAERYSALTASYFRGAHGVVMVYDVTSRETFQALQHHWLPEVKSHVNEDVVCLILGNKTDLSSGRQVSSEEGAQLARAHGCMYKEASAAAPDDNVHDALVWGLLSTVLDNEALLKAYAKDKTINVEAPRDHHWQHPLKQLSRCCN